MSLLYFFETTLEYHGVTSKELYKLWLKHAGPAFKLHEQGLMKYAFKVAGERTVIGVMSVESPGVLDTCFAELPLHQTLGDQIHTRFTPLRQYEGFATDLSQRAGSDTKYEEGKGVLKQGLFYLFTWTVLILIIQLMRLLFLMFVNAVCVLFLSNVQIFVNNFFFVLCQQVIAVVCVENPAEADRMSLDLPIMKKMGNRVHIECKSIRPIGEWVEDLKKLAE
ncbi:unnamed protein product [Porites evermanni]|uniref:Muconolactone isomerase domain-containing protein n=1 Tax=Porites evermanni TaxID=104178 RepID=A0ABN8PSV1_9CNID|nr:unnamed protein product [Porites evermanni]